MPRRNRECDTGKARCCVGKADAALEVSFPTRQMAFPTLELAHAAQESRMRRRKSEMLRWKSRGCVACADSNAGIGSCREGIGNATQQEPNAALETTMPRGICRFLHSRFGRRSYLKIAVVAPIPSAIVRIAVTANAGFLARIR